MEKKLTQQELLENLIRTASQPFTTSEQRHDIKTVLENSSNFHGMNHLFLVSCYFEENPLFSISEGKALYQAGLALKEGNPIAYYYLYLLHKGKEEQKARIDLRMAVHYKVPQALLEMARLLEKGEMFPHNQNKAFQLYQQAAEKGETEAYYGMLLIASKNQDIEKAKQIYKEAKEKGISLPGVVE